MTFLGHRAYTFSTLLEFDKLASKMKVTFYTPVCESVAHSSPSLGIFKTLKCLQIDECLMTFYYGFVLHQSTSEIKHLSIHLSTLQLFLSFLVKVSAQLSTSFLFCLFLY